MAHCPACLQIKHLPSALSFPSQEGQQLHVWPSELFGQSYRRCHGSVTRVYVPRFFVSSQQRFGGMDTKTLGASQLLGLGQTVLQLFTALFYLEDSRRVREGERKRDRERKERTHAGERVRQRALWLLLLYVFFLHLACPMQTGLSQECGLFCLKSSLWSLDLPLTFPVF